MENTGLNALDEDHKKAAIDSFVNFRDAYASKLEVENKLLAEYKHQFESQLTKCSEIEKNLNKYINLINALGGEQKLGESLTSSLLNFHKPETPIPVPMYLPEPKQSPDNDYIIKSKKKLQYPSSPKIKLQELVISTSYFKSDQELLSMLCYAFSMPNIPMKTVQNYLLELQAEGNFKRVKARKLNQFITGPVEWFDEFGIPKKEYLKAI